MKVTSTSRQGQQPRQPLTDSSATNQRLTRLEDRLAALLAERDKGLPVWVRSPKSGPEHYSGFSRAKLYALAGEGSIRSTSIREPGQLKGTRLFHLGSILALIEKSEAAAERSANP